MWAHCHTKQITCPRLSWFLTVGFPIPSLSLLILCDNHLHIIHIAKGMVDLLIFFFATRPGIASLFGLVLLLILNACSTAQMLAATTAPPLSPITTFTSTPLPIQTITHTATLTRTSTVTATPTTTPSIHNYT